MADLTENTEPAPLPRIVLDRTNLEALAVRIRAALTEYFDEASENIENDSGDDAGLLRVRLQSMASMRAGADMAISLMEGVAEQMPTGALMQVQIPEPTTEP